MDSLLAGSKIEYISMRPQTVTAIKKPLVCRICMVEENLNCIFENDSDTIAEKIRDCGKVEVSRNDGLPELICTNCINKVDMCFELRLQIQGSDTLLRKMYLENYKTNNETFSEEMGEPIEDSYYDDIMPDTNDVPEIKLEPRSPEMVVSEAEVEPAKPEELGTSKPPIDVDFADIKRSLGGRFHCPLCMLTFKAKKNLVRHHKIVHQEERYYCHSCDGVYTTLEYLQAHEIERHGEGLKAFECDFCKKKFRLLKMLRGHMKNHLSKNKLYAKNKVKVAPISRTGVERTEHICHICGTAFKGKASDDTAPTPDDTIKLEVADEEAPSYDEAANTKQYTCDKCGRCFGTKNKVAHHLQTAHFVAIGTGKYQCDICFQRFKVNKSLQSHKRVVHEQRRYECTQCDASYTTKFMMDLHVLDKHSAGEPVHECDVCHRKFGHERVLKNHIKSHKVKRVEARDTAEVAAPKTISATMRPCNRKSHICHICGSSFKGKSRVLNHIKYVHSEKPLFECDLCPQAYKDKKGLTNHKLVVHENVRFECDKCNVSYTAKYMLSLHKLSAHSNLEATHQCDICKKVYKHAVFLKRHKKTHNVHRLPIQPVTTETVVQKEVKYNYCTACNKNFAYRQLFTAHKAEHNGKFECRICHKIFPTDRTLTVHKSVIHDNPVLQCPTCDYNTTRPDLMKRHTKFVHDGFRFECEFCDKRFAKKKAADAHRVTHTEEQAPDPYDRYVITMLE